MIVAGGIVPTNQWDGIRDACSIRYGRSGFEGVSGERRRSCFAHRFGSGAFDLDVGSFRELSLLGLVLGFPVSASSPLVLC